MLNNQRIKNIEATVESLIREIESMKSDWQEYLNWKKMRDANEAKSKKSGSFFLPVDDNALLEKLIIETNKDPDLAVLITTAQGTTLTLRSHPQELHKERLYFSDKE